MLILKLTFRLTDLPMQDLHSTNAYIKTDFRSS